MTPPHPRLADQWLDTSSDELLNALRVLNGFDVDLAADLDTSD